MTVRLYTLQVPAQRVARRHGHVGRYHKSTAAKKAGGYSKSDLAAILGLDSFPAAAPVAAVTAAPRASSSSDEQVGGAVGSPCAVVVVGYSLADLHW